MSDTPVTPTTSAPKADQSTFRVTDVTDDGRAFLELADGRHIEARLKEGLEGVKRGSKVSITHDGLDKEGAPKGAVVTKTHA